MEDPLSSKPLRFEPVQGSHAIQEAVFFVHFHPPLPFQEIEKMARQLAASDNRFSRKTNLQKFDIGLSAEGAASFNHAFNGIEYQRVGSNNSTQWVLRLMEQGIFIHCLDYSRWNSVWPEARGLVLKLMNPAPAGTEISGIGLQYIDRFRYTPEAGDYDAAILFREDSKYLAARCFGAGDRWHCHSGWFTQLESSDTKLGFATECLNQLNIASSHDISTNEEQETFVTIDHALIVRAPNLGSFCVNEPEQNWLDALMLTLHQKNKKTMIGLLTEAVCRRLNLKLGEDNS